MANKITKKGTKYYVCATAKNDDLTQSEFAALTWVAVGNVGSDGDIGATSDLQSYDTMGDAVKQKQKGPADAGDFDLECAYVYNDAGQIILRSFGDPLNLDLMAFKVVLNDKLTSGGVGTTFYSRGAVSGPSYSGGSNSDFVVEKYTIGLVQLPTRVDPT